MKSVTLVVSLSMLLALNACGKPETPAEEVQRPQAREASASARQVVITPEAAKAADIETSEAGPARLREVLPLYGIVQPNAERMRSVAARFPGVVKSVQKRVGDAVKVGDILATVESNDSLQTYSVRAPIAGIVTARNVNSGENVAEQMLFTVADLSSVWVDLSLFPRDLTHVSVGQSVHVKTVDGERTGSGRIVWVSPLGTAESQSVMARALLDNPDRHWRPGLYVAGEVVLSEAEVPLAIHSTAVQTLDGEAVVFVQNSRGFEARAVKLGRSDQIVTEVLGGLKSGERYVSVNSFIVKAELGKAGAKDED